MSLKTSKRGGIPPFIVMDVMRAANEQEASGKDVLHLEVGQPSTPAPKAVLEAAASGLSSDRLGYTDALGVPDLRKAIARHYNDSYGIDVPWERVVVTTGSSGAFVVSFLASFDAGDRVALASPGYPAYRNILTALGVEPVLLPVGGDTNFQPTPELLEGVEGPLDGLIIASPSNPTGTMIHAQEMQDIVVYCEKRNIRLISDEIYHGITYEEDSITALAYTNQAVTINSFSKYFSMTGWRLGWMVVPESLLRAVECLSQNLFISPPTLSQLAAVEVFKCQDELDNNIAAYAENRKLLLEELPKIGFDKLAAAEGAFYIYADVAHLTNDSEAFCRQMLTETGVAATPGVDFDPIEGHHFVRFSFAGSLGDMAGAVRKLLDWLKK